MKKKKTVYEAHEELRETIIELRDVVIKVWIEDPLQWISKKLDKTP